MINLGVSGSLGCTGSIATTGYQGTSHTMYKCYHCDDLFWFEEITEVELEQNSQVLCKSCCREYRIEELIQPTFDLEI